MQGRWSQQVSGGDESLGSQDPTGSLLPQELFRVSGASWQQDDLRAWCYEYHWGLLEPISAGMDQGPGFTGTYLEPGVTGATWATRSHLGLLELTGAGETKEWVPRRL